MADEFNGFPIREQNLSQWRKRGYREWLEERQTAEAVRSVITGTTEFQKTRVGIADNVAVWFAARYFVAIKGMDDQEDGLNWKRMREFCDDLVRLRRGDHTSVRLDLTSRELQARSRRMAIRETKTLEHCSNISPRAKSLFEQLTAEIAAHREKKKGASRNLLNTPLTRRISVFAAFRKLFFARRCHYFALDCQIAG